MAQHLQNADKGRHNAIEDATQASLDLSLRQLDKPLAQLAHIHKSLQIPSTLCPESPALNRDNRDQGQHQGHIDISVGLAQQRHAAQLERLIAGDEANPCVGQNEKKYGKNQREEAPLIFFSRDVRDEVRSCLTQELDSVLKSGGYHFHFARASQKHRNQHGDTDPGSHHGVGDGEAGERLLRCQLNMRLGNVKDAEWLLASYHRPYAATDKAYRGQSQGHDNDDDQSFLSGHYPSLFLFRLRSNRFRNALIG